MNIDSKLKTLSENTGIPLKDVKRLCLVAGAELMEKGELVIRPNSRTKDSDVGADQEQEAA